MGGGFQEISWDGDIVWEYCSVLQHHDIEPLPNGNVLLILNETKTKNEVIEMGGNPDSLGNKTRGLHIIEVKNDGQGSSNIVWEWHVWDHLIQDFDSTKANYGNVSEHRELIDINFLNTGIDWLHTNSIDYNSELDQIIISHRHINEIWILDHSTSTLEATSHSGGNNGKGGDFLYRWGNPASYKMGTINDQQLFGQHDAHWIDKGLNGSGNILLFNNGLDRLDSSYSTVDEFSLPIDINGHYSYSSVLAFGPSELTWSYKMNKENYSSKFSSAQRLSNGNTLICSGSSGLFFEINPDNKIVWKYVNPVTADGPATQGEIIQNNSVGRCKKYGSNYLGFADVDLIPGKPIEIYSGVSIENRHIIDNKFILYDNYPNPFNPTTTISYNLSHKMSIKLEIFNIQGIKIATLVNQEQLPGKYSVDWNGRDSYGNLISSGIYFSKLFGEDKVLSNKMIFFK